MTQGVVNGQAVGLVFSGVTLNGTSVTPSCSGAVVVANVGFGHSAGGAVSYSGATETLSWSASGKNPGSGTVTVAPNATASTGTVSATKNGVNAAAVTVTFHRVRWRDVDGRPDRLLTVLGAGRPRSRWTGRQTRLLSVRARARTALRPLRVRRRAPA